MIRVQKNFSSPNPSVSFLRVFDSFIRNSRTKLRLKNMSLIMKISPHLGWLKDPKGVFHTFIGISVRWFLFLTLTHSLLLWCLSFFIVPPCLPHLQRNPFAPKSNPSSSSSDLMCGSIRGTLHLSLICTSLRKSNNSNWTDEEPFL